MEDVKLNILILTNPKNMEKDYEVLISKDTEEAKYNGPHKGQVYTINSVNKNLIGLKVWYIDTGYNADAFRAVLQASLHNIQRFGGSIKDIKFSVSNSASVASNGEYIEAYTTAAMILFD